MRNVCAFAALLLIPGMAPISASGPTTASVAVTVQVSARTSLHVSTHVLRFALSDDNDRATAAVDFAAGGRIPGGSDLVLTVQPAHALEGPGGAADAESVVTFEGDGNGTAAGTLASGAPAVAGRWQGSGLRQGRLLFTLRASAAGVYTLPVQFVLSMP